MRHGWISGKRSTLSQLCSLYHITESTSITKFLLPVYSRLSLMKKVLLSPRSITLTSMKPQPRQIQMSRTVFSQSPLRWKSDCLQMELAQVLEDIDWHQELVQLAERRAGVARVIICDNNLATASMWKSVVTRRRGPWVLSCVLPCNAIHDPCLLLVT